MVVGLMEHICSPIWAHPVTVFDTITVGHTAKPAICHQTQLDLRQQAAGIAHEFKTYVLKRLRGMELGGDAILADIIDEMLCLLFRVCPLFRVVD